MAVENRHVETYSYLVSALEEHRNVLNFAAPQKVAFSASLRFFSKSFFWGFSFLFLRCMNIQSKLETRVRPNFQEESNHFTYDTCSFLLHPVATGAESIFEHAISSAVQNNDSLWFSLVSDESLSKVQYRYHVSDMSPIFDGKIHATMLIILCF